MNRDWLMDNADVPIQYNLTRNEKLLPSLETKGEVQYWLSQLTQRAENNDLSNIHGSHDYRLENILGKCFLLGLSKSAVFFSKHLDYVLDFLHKHTGRSNDGELSFGKLYANRDYETVLACFLPFLGYADDPSVRFIAEKRINILYPFVIQKRYDIYIDGSKLKGVKKEWQPFVIDPDLYADGNITLPTMHDYILLAGMYPFLSKEEKAKTEQIVNWVFGEGYGGISRRYGYFYIPGGSYDVKAMIFKMHLESIENIACGGGELTGLLFTCNILSHFESARQSEWFRFVFLFLESHKL